MNRNCNMCSFQRCCLDRRSEDWFAFLIILVLTALIVGTSFWCWKVRDERTYKSQAIQRGYAEWRVENNKMVFYWKGDK